MTLVCIIAGIGAGLFVDQTKVFVLVCGVIGIVMAFVETSKWAILVDQQDMSKEKKSEAIAGIFVNHLIGASIVALVAGGLTRLFVN